jgi:hypothetical protein
MWTLLYAHTTNVITRQSEGLNAGCEAAKLLGKASGLGLKAQSAEAK